MSSKADRTLIEALGVPDSDTVTKLEWSTGLQVSGVLLPNTTYRLAADDDCYFRLAEENDEELIDNDDTILFGSVPEVFQTDTNRLFLTVSGVNSSANLWATRMIQPAK